MPKIDKTGMILVGGAVGLGLLLLPGYFQKRAKAEGEGEEEDAGSTGDALKN